MEDYNNFMEFLGKGRYSDEVWTYLRDLHSEQVFQIYAHYIMERPEPTETQLNTIEVLVEIYRQMTGIEIKGIWDGKV